MGARDLPTLADADAILAAILREYLAPPPRETVTEWAEGNRVLSGKDSAEPGPYRVARTPYAREPMDALSPLSAVEEVVLIWGAQTSKTTIGNNWVGASIHRNPGPLMIVWPTISVAKRNSRQRLAPMIDESPALRRLVADNRSRDEANTTLLKEFPGGFLAIAGANSAADLRSMPVRDLFLDEIDNYPHDVDGEGDPVDLAIARQTTFARKKRLLTSTPTTRDMSRIESRYLASDRCRYHVPCPHCGELQPLEWGADKAHGIKWSRAEDGTPDPASVRYVCAANGCEIREHHKPQMLAGGAWVAEAPGAQRGKVRGFQLSSLYSPLGWLSWQTLVTEWHAAQLAAAQGRVEELRVFVNTRLAETFEETGDKADQHQLQRRAHTAEDQPLGLVRSGCYVRTLGVDVQGDRLEAYDWAWGRGMERQLVDRRIFYGDPALPETDDGSPWAALTAYRRAPVLQRSGRPVPLLAALVDSGGHHTQAVYAYARTHQHAHVHAVKGSSIAGKPVLGKPSDVQVNWRGAKVKGGVKLWPIGTDTAKAAIYGALRCEQPGAGYVHLSKALPPDVFEQLTAERLVTRYVKGRPKLEWIKPAGKRNEALDCAVYALAAAHYVGIDRWRDGEWKKWQDRVEPENPGLWDEPHLNTPRSSIAAGVFVQLAGRTAAATIFDPDVERRASTGQLATAADTAAAGTRLVMAKAKASARKAAVPEEGPKITDPDLVDRIFEYVVAQMPQLREAIALAEAKAAVRAEFGGQSVYIARRAADAQRLLAQQVLSHFNGRNATEVARVLQIGRATVYRIIKQARVK